MSPKRKSNASIEDPYWEKAEASRRCGCGIVLSVYNTNDKCHKCIGQENLLFRPSNVNSRAKSEKRVLTDNMMEEAARIVAEGYGIGEDLILSGSNDRNAIEARQVVIYFFTQRMEFQSSDVIRTMEFVSKEYLYHSRRAVARMLIKGNQKIVDILWQLKNKFATD